MINQKRNLIVYSYLVYNVKSTLVTRTQLENDVYEFLINETHDSITKKSWKEILSKLIKLYIQNKFISESISNEHRSKKNYQIHTRTLLSNIFFNKITHPLLKEILFLLGLVSGGYDENNYTGEVFIDAVKVTKLFHKHLINNCEFTDLSFSALFSDDNLLLQFDLENDLSALTAYVLTKSFSLLQNLEENNINTVNRSHLFNLYLTILPLTAINEFYVMYERKPEYQSSVSFYLESKQSVLITYKHLENYLKERNVITTFRKDFDALLAKIDIHYRGLLIKDLKDRLGYDLKESVYEFEDKLYEQEEIQSKYRNLLQIRDDIIEAILKKLNLSLTDPTIFLEPKVTIYMYEEKRFVGSSDINSKLIERDLKENDISVFSSDQRKTLENFGFFLIQSNVECYSCKNILRQIKITCYNHDTGWQIPTFDVPQWIIIKCEYCLDSYSLNKLFFEDLQINKAIIEKKNIKNLIK